MVNYEVVVEEQECSRPDGSRMALRITRPRGEGPFPAVVDIHGGGWITGTRSDNAIIDNHLARNGIVAVAPEFRMPPLARYPVAIADIMLSVCWLKANARALGSRPDLVGAVGTSSGAHQLLTCALRPNDPRYAAQVNVGSDRSLAFIVACWPVADPLRRYQFARDNKLENLLKAHSLYWLSEADMADGNPQLILEWGLAEHLPPLLVIQGTADDNLPNDSAQRFAAAWKAANGDVTLKLFEGQPHTFINRAPEAPASREALAEISSFIVAQTRATL